MTKWSLITQEARARERFFFREIWKNGRSSRRTEYTQQKDVAINTQHIIMKPQGLDIICNVCTWYRSTDLSFWIYLSMSSLLKLDSYRNCRPSFCYCLKSHTVEVVSAIPRFALRQGQLLTLLFVCLFVWRFQWIWSRNLSFLLVSNHVLSWM
jgi:hypothetical protein